MKDLVAIALFVTPAKTAMMSQLDHANLLCIAKCASSRLARSGSSICQHALVDREISNGVTAENVFPNRRESGERSAYRRDSNDSGWLDRIAIDSCADARECDGLDAMRRSDLD